MLLTLFTRYQGLTSWINRLFEQLGETGKTVLIAVILIGLSALSVLISMLIHRHKTKGKDIMGQDDERRL